MDSPLESQSISELIPDLRSVSLPIIALSEIGTIIRDEMEIEKELENAMSVDTFGPITVSIEECQPQRPKSLEMDKSELATATLSISGEKNSKQSPRSTPGSSPAKEDVNNVSESVSSVVHEAMHQCSPKLAGEMCESSGKIEKVSESQTSNGPTLNINVEEDKETSLEVKQNSSGRKQSRGYESCNGTTKKSRTNGFSKIVDSPELRPRKSARLSFGSTEAKNSSPEQPFKKCKMTSESVSFFVGDPIPTEEAQERWGWRYEMKNQRSKGRTLKSDDDDEDKIVSNVECHYSQAQINGCIFSLGDCAYIKGEEAEKHIGKILEFFKTTDGEKYLRVQWFYKAEDTVMKQQAASHEKKRLFYSTVMNDNPIDCIESKVTVLQKSPWIGKKSKSKSSNFYFDMEYCVEYSTFRTLKNPMDRSLGNQDQSLTHCIKDVVSTGSGGVPHHSLLGNGLSHDTCKNKLALLDLYAGCGGMSTGLCLGAKLAGIDLVTRWAVDRERSACVSLKLNHPEALVRNDAAEDFLHLLKEWEKLCKRYVSSDDIQRDFQTCPFASTEVTNEVISSSDDNEAPVEYEVERLLDICYGDPSETGKRGLKFKVHWKGYGSSEDSWEPVEGLRNCKERIQEFVRKGYKSKFLPLPGDVDIICGGPPCQGISGYNRHRNVTSPLADEKNRQIIVFMDIVEFLKPKFVLMENVVDIMKLAKGTLVRYALSRLVHMKYQARLGTMAAGCYGLPQFRLRVFLWGAHPTQNLPQFPLPTHDVIVRYWPTIEFERNTVAYDEGQPRDLEKALLLQDAISDLPAVGRHENRDEMPYEKPPETEFQRYIRSSKYEMTGSAAINTPRMNKVLYDHVSCIMSDDDYQRVCQIPKKKGANFRDLPGIIVGNDNVVRRDPKMDPVLLPSGKQLIPDYVFTFEQGKSKRPFGRVWWDETVATLLTVPYFHSQAILHPEQDRVLTVREYARLQGFPDYYRFHGTVKERYCQVGNAVAIPVARALGYTMAMAFQNLCGKEPLMKLPPKFAHSTRPQLTQSLLEKLEE